MSIDPALQATDPFAREAENLPVLREAMAARVARYGDGIRVARGDHAFDGGQRGVVDPSVCPPVHPGAP